jgi:hypothetical protein
MGNSCSKEGILDQKRVRSILLLLVIIISIVVTFSLWNLGDFVSSLAKEPVKWDKVNLLWVRLGTFSVIFLAVFGLVGSWASIDGWIKSFFASKESEKLCEIETSLTRLYNQQAKREWNLNLLTFPSNGKQELTDYLLVVCERLEYLKLVDSHKIASRDFFDERQFVGRFTIADLGFCFLGNVHILPNNMRNIVKQQLLGYINDSEPATCISGLRFFIFFHEILTSLQIDYPKQSRMYVANAIIFSRLLTGQQKLCPYYNINVIFNHECNIEQFDRIVRDLLFQVRLKDSKRRFLDRSDSLYYGDLELIDVVHVLYSEFFLSNSKGGRE